MHKIINIKLNQDSDPEQEIKKVLDAKYFPKYKYRVKAGVEYTNAKDENIFKWSISDWHHSYEPFVFANWEHQIENEEFEGSGFIKQNITHLQIEIYKTKDIKASSYVELPNEYKNISFDYKYSK